MQLIDLSHTIEPDMTLFSSAAPQPRITAWMSHAEAAAGGHYVDCSCEITEVQFVTSTGTYLDSPYHFNPRGESIERLRLEQLVLAGVVVDCTTAPANVAIGPEVLDGHELRGKAVLFHSGWSRFWKQPEYLEYPFLGEALVLALCERGAKLAGVDFLTADDPGNPRRPAHVKLLFNNTLIVENLANLGALPAGGFTFHAVPVKMAGAAAFPVRAYATVDG